jgi:hypothetical protein
VLVSIAGCHGESENALSLCDSENREMIQAESGKLDESSKHDFTSTTPGRASGCNLDSHERNRSAFAF